MATVRARALSLRVLLVLALCLTATAAERQPTKRYISYAGLPRAGGGNRAGAPRGNARNLISAAGRCKDCHGQPPTKAAAVTATAESKGTDLGLAAAMKTGGKNEAAAMTGANKKAAAGSEGAYMTPAAVSEEKRRYISYAALKHNQPQAKCPRRSCA